MKTVVCPGSFDPITNGHLDIIKRAAKLFDNVIVLVANNIAKTGNFTIEERCEMINTVIAKETNLTNVKIESFDGLLVDYIKNNNISAVVKGLRAVSDFEYEFQMALTNRHMYNDFETLFFTPANENMYLSSSIVRQIGSFGGDISDFVPHCLLDTINKKFVKHN